MTKMKRRQRRPHGFRKFRTSTLETLEQRLLLAADWQNPVNPLDVDASETAEPVSPLDALLVINELNFPTISDATTGRLPELGPEDFAAPPFLDVDADGYVSPFDAILVVNELNFEENVGGEGMTSVFAPASVIAGSHAAAENGVTDDTLVNTVTAKNQSFPDVAANAQGSIVSTWQSFGQDGSSWGIFAQRYAADGSKVGSEFQVNSTTRGSQRDPAVAVSDDGSFFIVWQSLGQDGSSWGVYGQEFDSDGNAVGSEMLLNTTTRGPQLNADIATNGSGYSVVWQGQGPGDHTGIFSRNIAADGSMSEVVRVNTVTSGSQTDPAIAVNSAGQNVIVWDGNAAGDHNGVAMRIGSNEPILVNLDARGRQIEPSVSVSATDDIVVAWQQIPEVGWGIWARQFTPDGSQGGDVIQVNQTMKAAQKGPSVDYLADGSFAVSWFGRGMGDRRGTFARTFGTDGVATSDEMLMNSTTRCGQIRPALAAVNAGYVVLWQGLGEGDHKGIFARFVDTGVVGPFVIDPIADMTVNEGGTVAFTATVTDLDGTTDMPTFSLDDMAPAAATIDPTTGAFSWTTTEADGPGNYSITVTASEGDFSSSSTFIVTVNEVNTAPVLDPIPDQTALADTLFTLTITASDSDLPPQTLTFASTLADGSPLPGWLTFDAATATYSGTPAVSDAGVIDVEATVTDTGGLSDSQTFTITVTSNQAPIVSTPIPNQVTPEGTQFTLNVSGNFSDPDGDTLTFTTGDLPAWLSFNGTTGVFMGTPGNADVGSTEITVTAADPDGLSVSDTFSLTVTDVNTFPPNMTDQTFRLSPSAANGTVVGTVLASDPDPSDVLTFSITAGNANNVFAIDPSSGTITVADNTNLGNVDITLTVQASDGTFSTMAEVLIVITDDTPTVAYSIMAVDAAGAVLTEVSPGQQFDFVLSVEDISANPTGVFSAYADMYYMSDFVSVNGTPIHSAVYPSGTSADTSVAGIINEAGGVDGIEELGGDVLEVVRIPMIVSNDVAGGTTISFTTGEADDPITHPTLMFGNNANTPLSEIVFGTFTLTVAGEAVDPPGENAPNITDQVFRIPANAAMGSTVGTVVAADPDDDVITYSIVSGNAGGAFAINSATGVITVANSANLGTSSEINVRASDGSNSNTAVVSIFASSDPLLASYQLSAVDAGGNAITSVAPGDTFELVMTVQDVSASPTGIFSAFADIGYQFDFVSVDGPVAHSSVYPSGTSAGLTTPGLIDEAGGVDGISELGGDAIEVLRVPMVVSSDVMSGVVISFATNPTEDAISHPTLMFGQNANTPNSQIDWGTFSLEVVSAMPLSAMSSSASDFDFADSLLNGDGMVGAITAGTTTTSEDLPVPAYAPASTQSVHDAAFSQYGDDHESEPSNDDFGFFDDWS